MKFGPCKIGEGARDLSRIIRAKNNPNGVVCPSSCLVSTHLRTWHRPLASNLLTQGIMRRGLGIALQYSRPFYSACVGRCWRRSLRCAPLFFIRIPLVNIQRAANTYRCLRKALQHRCGAIFFIACKITLMQCHKRRSRVVLPSRWGGKITRKNARNSCTWLPNSRQPVSINFFFFTVLFRKYTLNQGRDTMPHPSRK